MNIRCIWEHNGEHSLIYAENLPGAYTRGETKEAALAKLPAEAAAWLRWAGKPVPASFQVEIIQEKPSSLEIRDADSDVIFDAERLPLTREAYMKLKALAMKSARDFLALYEAVPDRDKSCLPERECFHGSLPRTAREMYEHTRNVNDYYFGEIGLEADHDGTIAECRARGFALLEQQPDFLSNPVLPGSYGEEWSLRKVLRRFIWHDRIHAKAMYRMAARTFPETELPDIFRFFT